MPGTQRDIPYLEEKFQTGDIPTQQDFYDLFASFLHYLQVKQTEGSSVSDVMSQKAITDLIFAVDRYLGKATDAGTNRTINAQGSETNIDVSINPKGLSGRLKSDSLVGVGEAAAKLRADGALEREEVIELKTWNSTTAELSKSTLNSTYPSATRGVQVVCPSISGGGKIYEKIDDVTNDWASISITIVV